MEGLVKTQKRCQAKAETDYADREFPVTAAICDFVRCSLVFETSDNMLAAMKKFENAVESGDTSLKKIVRIKNMFLENKRENDNVWDLYRYADIKYNVIMTDEYKKISMVVCACFTYCCVA